MGAHFAVIAAGNGPQMVIAGERFALDNSTIAQGRANGSRIPQRYNITYFNLTCVHLGCWSSQLFP